MFQALFGNRQTKENPVKQMTVAELKTLIDQGTPPLLVDVRSVQEYEKDGHIAGTRLLPLPALNQRRDELPKDQAIVCICRSGNRSQVAAEQLQAHGYGDVANLVGGMRQWRSAGYPVA